MPTQPLSPSPSPLDQRQRWLILATGLGCALTGGVFFAFSSFVMPALDDLPASHAISAMQAINRAAVTAPFMTAVFAPALACCYLAFQAYRRREAPESRWVLAGTGLYLVGAIGVTIMGNVPLNDTLATVHPHAATAAARWHTYTSQWTGLNTLRAVCGLAGATALLVALRPRTAESRARSGAGVRTAEVAAS